MALILDAASFAKDGLFGTRWECLECSVLVRNPQRHSDFHAGLRVRFTQAFRAVTEGQEDQHG